MSNFNTPGRLFVSCYKRLSPYLQQEVQALGYTPDDVSTAGLKLTGSLYDAMRLNMHLRTASQVYYELASFTADDPDALYREVYRIDWPEWLRADGYVSITSFVQHPSINNPMYANIRVKDAVVDKFRDTVGQRPDTGPLLSKAVVHLFWTENGASLYLDTSGETLAKHGYRLYPGKAPMLESLAAATVLASGWDPSKPLLNPMCGSGTLAIEAALLATHRKPGLLRRNYGFMHLVPFERDAYLEAVLDLEDEVIDLPTLSIYAGDHSREAIRLARMNAEKAGVADRIRFEYEDFRRTRFPSQAGTLLLNPEYGERLGELDELASTYKEIGDWMKKNAQGWEAYIFSGNPELAKHIGLQASRRIEFYNGRIDSRLLRFELYAGSRQRDKGDAPPQEQPN